MPKRYKDRYKKCPPILVLLFSDSQIRSCRASLLKLGYIEYSLERSGHHHQDAGLANKEEEKALIRKKEGETYV